MSGRETQDNGESQDGTLFKAYVYISDQEYRVTSKRVVLIDVIIEFGSLFLSVRGALFILSLLYTRFSYFRSVVS